MITSTERVKGYFTTVEVMLPPKLPVVLSALSRLTHGSAGTFDNALTVGTLATMPSVEPRRVGGAEGTGTFLLVLTFDKPVTSGAYSIGDGYAEIGTVTYAGSQAFVPLTKVHDFQYVSLFGSNINGSGSGAALLLRVAFYYTKTKRTPTGTGYLTNTSDILLLNAGIGQAPNASNFNIDANCDGVCSGSGTTITGERFRVTSGLLSSTFPQWRSRKVHGPGGVNITIDRLMTNAAAAFNTVLPIVESRAGRAPTDPRFPCSHKIIVHFDGIVTAIGGCTFTNRVGRAVGNTSCVIKLNTVEVSLTNVYDHTWGVITITGIVGPSVGSFAGHVGFNIGDCNNSLTCTSTDSSALRARNGWAISYSSHIADLDTNGSIISLNNGDPDFDGNYQNASSITSTGYSISAVAQVQFVKSDPTHPLMGGSWALTNIFSPDARLTAPINGTLLVEPRDGGQDVNIMVYCADIANRIQSVTATDSLGNTYPVTFTIDFNTNFANQDAGTWFCFSIAGIPNNRRVALAIVGMNGILDYTFNFGVLYGDADLSNTVDAADVAAINAHFANPVGLLSYQYDLNCDGIVDATDAAIATTHLGETLNP